MTTVPDAVSIEIYERAKKTGAGADSVICPDEIRINGQPVLAPDQSITVHEIRPAAYGELVQVTLTLFARRVTIGAELD